MTTDISALRSEYSRQALDEAEVDADPFVQFKNWFDDVIRASLREPNAMVLATVSVTGRPSARTVLLKGADASGFVFFTNYESRKAEDLAHSPQASLLFVWLELERQIRIEGVIEKISAQASDAYFHSRPLDSRIGAWASPQSRVVADRAELEQRFATASEQQGAHPTRPANWGGYRLAPDTFEFWQGRPSRLHDRIRYRLDDERWRIDRLAP